MQSDKFSTLLFKFVTVIMILTYTVMVYIVVVDDIKYPNMTSPQDGKDPEPAPAPPDNQLISIFFTGLTTAFAIYTGKILGIEISKPESSSLNLRDKIRRLFASIFNGLSKGNLPGIGAALFVIATTIGFFVYLSEVRKVPNLSDQPISDLLKNLASSFVGVILGLATSGNTEG